MPTCQNRLVSNTHCNLHWPNSITSSTFSQTNTRHHAAIWLGLDVVIVVAIPWKFCGLTTMLLTQVRSLRHSVGEDVAIQCWMATFGTWIMERYYRWTCLFGLVFQCRKTCCFHNRQPPQPLMLSNQEVIMVKGTSIGPNLYSVNWRPWTSYIEIYRRFEEILQLPHMQALCDKRGRPAVVVFRKMLRMAVGPPHFFQWIACHGTFPIFSPIWMVKR